MKTSIHSSREGFVLFYMMGIITLLSMFGLVAYQSAILEARTARHHAQTVEAIYHAEAGARLVKRAVEDGLEAGQELQDILTNLSVSAPTNLNFDTISSFTIIVPKRAFSFSCTGRSGDASARVTVQYLRPSALQAGVWGSEALDTQSGINTYGYDGRTVSNPTSADSNGGASVGSNEEVEIGNSNTLDGNINLGEVYLGGTTATCTGCANIDTYNIGYVEPDPLGANGGKIEELADFYANPLNNDNLSTPWIILNRLVIPNHTTATISGGNYYLVDFDISNHNKLIIDESNGPVRIYIDGEFYIGSHGEVEVTKAINFQIYNVSNDDVKIQPQGDFTGMVYAPFSEVRIQPNGSFYGTAWGLETQVQPGANIFIDTSMQDAILKNNLEVLAWYEERDL